MAEESKIKPNPFRVPENYFDEVNRKILDSTVNHQDIKKFTVSGKFRPLLAIAASVAILIAAGYISVKLFEKKTIYPEVSQIINSSPEILLEEIDPYMLENSASIAADFEKDSDLTNDEIIDYLIDEDIDISMIYEKL